MNQTRTSRELPVSRRRCRRGGRCGRGDPCFNASVQLGSKNCSHSGAGVAMSKMRTNTETGSGLGFRSCTTQPTKAASPWRQAALAVHANTTTGVGPAGAVLSSMVSCVSRMACSERSSYPIRNSRPVTLLVLIASPSCTCKTSTRAGGSAQPPRAAAPRMHGKWHSTALKIRRVRKALAGGRAHQVWINFFIRRPVGPGEKYQP